MLKLSKEDFEKYEATFRAGLKDMNVRDEFFQSLYVTPPVAPEQFLDDPDYLGFTGQSLWPANRDIFLNVIAPAKDATIILLTGSTRWGKGFLASISMAWFLYNFLNLKSPHAHMGLAISSPLVAACTSVSSTHAFTSFVKELRGMLRSSKWFSEIVPFEKNRESEILFRGGDVPGLDFQRGDLTVMPSAPDTLANIGLNLVLAQADEFAFMERVSRSKRAVPGEVEYDQAENLLDNLEKRMSATTVVGDRVMGKILITTSAHYEGDAADRLTEKRQGDPKFLCISHNQIETKPGLFTKDTQTFRVYLGDERFPPKIIEDGDIEEYAKDRIELVPVVFKEIFKTNIHKALRDILGKRTRLDTHLFPDREQVKACSKGMPSMFPIESDLTNIPLLVQDLLRLLKKDVPYAAHFDLSLTTCKAGFAMSCAEGVDPIPEGCRVVEDTKDRMRVRTDVAMSISPNPTYGEVWIPDTEELILQLLAAGVKIFAISWDGFQSANSRQRLSTLIRYSFTIAIDRSKDVYYTLKHTFISKGRWRTVYHPTLQTELCGLLDLENRKHIEKPSNGSKDLSDAVASSIFSLYTYANELPLGNTILICPIRSDPGASRPSCVLGERRTAIKPW